ncbi:MAG TPA: hypothetical protein VKP30_13895 [Polyangiaceae bacterium]|nr:hypothetical protein [Polyangiaceae bacterium]
MAHQAASFRGLMSQRERRTYDHRIEVQIRAAGDLTVSWIRRDVGSVVT